MRSFLLQHAAQYDAVVGRYHDQRTREQNHRGASKGCIERNTFPHKFKRVPREKTEDQGGSSEQQADQEEEEEGDKCTICLCGKTVGVKPTLSEMHCHEKRLLIRCTLGLPKFLGGHASNSTQILRPKSVWRPIFGVNWRPGKCGPRLF